MKDLEQIVFWMGKKWWNTILIIFRSQYRWTVENAEERRARGNKHRNKGKMAAAQPVPAPRYLARAIRSCSLLNQRKTLCVWWASCDF